MGTKHVKALQDIIEAAFVQRQELSPATMDQTTQDAIKESIALLDQGKRRIAEQRDGQWHINQWLKKAVLLSFRMQENDVHNHQITNYYDKVPLKFANYQQQDFEQLGSRVIPPACVRQGCLYW